MARRLRTALLLAPLLALASVSTACRQRPPDTREWRPTDHSREDGETPFDPSLPPLEDNDPTLAAAGLFAVQCANCHGREGRGDGPGAQGPIRPPDFTAASFHALWTDDALRAAIRSGRNSMPAFGQTLRPEAIDQLVTLVRSFGAPRPSNTH